MFEILFVLSSLIAPNFTSTQAHRNPVSVVSSSMEVIKIRIDSEKVSCNGNATNSCYRVQKESSIGKEFWETMPQEIEGFNYEPGYVYDLVVRVEVQENKTGPDRFRHILEHVVAKVKA